MLRSALLALALAVSPAVAQFATPAIDGAIGANEYGTNNSVSTATAQTWYMTWDDTNLYVAVTNANLAEGAVVYIGTRQISPPRGGTNAEGNLSGFTYDGTGFSALPFRANFVTYFKDGYREYRTSDGAGGWSGATANYGAYASGAGNVRELAIPWAATGARPASFLFFVYLTSSGGYVYGQAPGENAGAFIGTSAAWSHYFAVTSTADGASTPPFSVDSFSNLTGIDFASLKHDSFDPFYRSPAGAATEEAQITLRFRTGHFDVDGVSVRAYLFDTGSGVTAGPVDTPMAFDQNTVENGVTYDQWKATLTMPATPAVYYYKFLILKAGATAFYSDDYLDDNDNLNKGGAGAADNSEPFPSFQVTVYDPNFQTPAWLQNANVYQIFPDRFRNGDIRNDYCRPGATTGCPVYYASQQAVAHTVWNEPLCDPHGTVCPGAFGNQFFGGDLAGIRTKLDYLAALGVDALYLTPVFAARSNHRYDTDNYLTIDPALGAEADFTSLATEMDRRGMRLILDGVFNHASSDSLYFDRYHRYPTDGACESLTSTWRTWFHFSDNNVPCTSADYPGWFGLDSLPTFDHTVAAVKDFFYSGTDNVMAHWYSRGASGWRFDVAPDPNFPRAWWKDTRSFAKGYRNDGPLIGEIWPNASQWLAGDQLDSTMNYRFRKNVIGFARNANWSDDNNNGVNNIPGLAPSQFDHALRAVRDDYPPQASYAMLNLLDSHDTNRALFVLTELGDAGLTQAKQRLELAALFQFTYLGAPMVFYGDEVAINSPSLFNGANGPVGDPYTRAPFPWPDQSGNVATYGPPDPDVFSYYTRLAHLRKQHECLRTGAFATLLTGDTQQAGAAANTYAFARTGAGETAIVALNNGAALNNAAIPAAAFFADGARLRDPLTGRDYTVSAGSVTVALGPRSGAVLLPSPAVVDLLPPVAAIRLTPEPNGNGVNRGPVTVNILATDPGGSGVSELRYWLNNGPTQVAAGGSTSFTINTQGVTVVQARAIDNAGNVGPAVSRTVKIAPAPKH
jgi:glycosidase